MPFQVLVLYTGLRGRWQDFERNSAIKDFDVAKEALRAESRIRPHIVETAVEVSRYLSGEGRADVWCKLENLQHTGSFKVRGALNKILSLSGEQIDRGVVTASTGNHGAAVAYSLGITGGKGTIFVPEGASEEKLKLIRDFGVRIERYGTDNCETEIHAREYARRESLEYISPYNDREVIAGQGTIGVELQRQLTGIDAVFLSVGGGGLASGVAGYLKDVSPGTEIVGCSPVNSMVMIESVRAGRILDIPSFPTLSDGTAGGLEPGSITFDLCRRHVDDYVTVTEQEIRESMASFIRRRDMIIEGAAAVSIASFLKVKERFRGKKVVIVICGGNVSEDILKQVL